MVREGIGRFSTSIADNNPAKDQCGAYPSKDAARKIALRTVGVPTSSAPIAQNIVPQWEQYMYKNPIGSRIPIILSHHPADKDHSCPHWHAGAAKVDDFGGVQQRNNGNGTFSWKYQNEYPAIEHRN